VRLVLPVDAVVVEQAGELRLAGVVEVYPAYRDDALLGDRLL
jgi:hypothetical protein